MVGASRRWLAERRGNQPRAAGAHPTKFPGVDSNHHCEAQNLDGYHYHTREYSSGGWTRTTTISVQSRGDYRYPTPEEARDRRFELRLVGLEATVLTVDTSPA